jgi:hypothetical protein
MEAMFRPEETGKENPGVSGGEEICIICGRGRQEGLHIVEEFICNDCEREMVRTEVWDAKYPFFIHRMKQMWRRKDA